MSFASILSSFCATSVCLAVTCGISAAGVTVTRSLAEGIGEEEGVMRRDPSDIIKVKDLYYVWYSKGAFPHGYDASLVVRDGKYWMYFKGRQWEKSYTETRMGVAIAEKPGGPYLRHPGNPVVAGGHEVVVWPYGKGVVAQIGGIGTEEVRNTFQYAGDGLTFTKMMKAPGGFPTGAGTYRPEAFTDSGKGEMIAWGLEIRGKRGALPFLGRFDCEWKN